MGTWPNSMGSSCSSLTIWTNQLSLVALYAVSPGNCWISWFLWICLSLVLIFVNIVFQHTLRPSDYYPLLVRQVGGDEIAERSPKAIKRDFRALGRQVEGSGAQVVFSSIPSVAGKSIERGRKTLLINTCLRDWWNFDFFDHEEVYTASGLLETDGVQLSQRGKRILGHELAGLLERTLN